MFRGLVRRNAVFLALLLTAGCTEERPANRYESINGEIRELSADTGEITLAAPPVGAFRAEASALRCLCTKDTEIYINDRFSNFDALRVGDTLRLVGYREASSESRRLVASYVRIERPRPPSESPVSLTSRPATGP